MTEPDLSDAIEQAAQAPARVSGDAGSVDQQPLPDIIKADQYLSAKRGIQTKNLGLRSRKITPPGAV